MLKSALKPQVKNLLNQIMAADVVKVDDDFYVLKKQTIDDTGCIEDFVIIVDTDVHQFNWWEIREDSTQINEREWQIGRNVVSFYSLQPL